MPADTTVTRTVAIGSTVGLHARPAAALVKAAAGLPAVVTLTTKDGKSANAASMLMVLALGAEHGDELTLTADGEGAEAAVEALAELLASDLDA